MARSVTWSPFGDMQVPGFAARRGRISHNSSPFPGWRWVVQQPQGCLPELGSQELRPVIFLGCQPIVLSPPLWEQKLANLQ